MLSEKKYETYTEIAACIREKIHFNPKIAIVLGTGLGSLVDDMEEKVEIPYKEISGFLHETVAGHPGKFIVGKLQGIPLLAMAGRFHSYDGYDEGELAMPVYVMKILGIENLILTNAAGAINFHFHPGDIAIITDHINFQSISPMRGRNLEEFGPRFFPVTEIYNREMQEIAKKSAVECGFSLKEGVYFYTLGPHFESPAEIRAIRALGGDMVGMSTVPEILTAAHVGMDVLALSLQTNYSSDRIEIVDGKEIDEVAEEAKGRFLALVEKIITKL